MKEQLTSTHKLIFEYRYKKAKAEGLRELATREKYAPLREHLLKESRAVEISCLKIAKRISDIFYNLARDFERKSEGLS